MYDLITSPSYLKVRATTAYKRDFGSVPRTGLKFNFNGDVISFPCLMSFYFVYQGSVWPHVEAVRCDKAVAKYLVYHKTRTKINALAAARRGFRLIETLRGYESILDGINSRSNQSIKIVYPSSKWTSVMPFLLSTRTIADHRVDQSVTYRLYIFILTMAEAKSLVYYNKNNRENHHNQISVSGDYFRPSIRPAPPVAFPERKVRQGSSTAVKLVEATQYTSIGGHLCFKCTRCEHLTILTISTIMEFPHHCKNCGLRFENFVQVVEFRASLPVVTHLRTVALDNEHDRR